MLHEGWRGAMTPFLLAIALDCIYQLGRQCGLSALPLEVLFTATLLALVPYACAAGTVQSPRPAVSCRVLNRPQQLNQRTTNKLSHCGNRKEGCNSMSRAESKTQDWSIEACRNGDPQGRVFAGEGRAGPLRTHLSQDPGFELRLLDPEVKNNPWTRGRLLQIRQKH